MISPVWLQVRPNIDGTAVIEGLHDIDSSWISSVHQLNGNIKIGMAFYFILNVSFLLQSVPLKNQCMVIL